MIANGDITTPEKALHVLDGNRRRRPHDRPRRSGPPWLFREIEHYLKTGEHLPPARVGEITPSSRPTWPTSTSSTAETGFRVARKHIAWYTEGWW